MDTLLLHARSILLVLFTTLAAPTLASQNTILIMGDSLSAAYGVRSEAGWVQLLRQRLERNGLSHWEVINASISGETADGGARRLPELIEKHGPDVVIIELGGNDGLRGFPPNVIESNLATMIEATQNSGAQALLVGMQMPPNYGPRYTRMFAELYPTLSDRYNTELVPFFLDGIYNHDNMMQADGIHPTEQAQPKLLDKVWPILEPMLQEERTASNGS
ncbi:arylesterase [Marinobacter pelagius]|uniref:arylesterase n=1 Tax=Marinobacter sp. C7 TaxID=2951363 RepID=UPI001EF11B51|nr:arylesterase [Marinobacter sp. C7]MCG7199891.1 arylesterase [Marinobacter sp. C7]